jgi:hypothetical protein
MTIAHRVPGGNGDHLILAADQQFTAQGAYKIRRKKYATSKQGYVEIACFFSGSTQNWAGSPADNEPGRLCLQAVTPM